MNDINTSQNDIFIPINKVGSGLNRAYCTRKVEIICPNEFSLGLLQQSSLEAKGSPNNTKRKAEQSKAAATIAKARRR